MLVLCKFANVLDPKETPWKDSRRLPGQRLHDWSRIRPCRIEGVSPLNNLRHQDTDLEDFQIISSLRHRLRGLWRGRSALQGGQPWEGRAGGRGQHCGNEGNYQEMGH